MASAGPAHAFPTIYEEWAALYPESTVDDQLITATGAPCQVCHVNPGGGSPWNQYGFAVLSNGGLGNLPGAFFAVEPLDSDGEGHSNLDEINANATPGWCDNARPGCQNLAWTRSGTSSPATPPAGVTLDPAPGSVPPVADPGGPYTGTAGTPVLFDGSASFDPDGDIVAWQWAFGDGFSASGASPAHVYAVAGEYLVTLTVTDSAGLQASAATTATIVPDQPVQPPVAVAGGPYTGTEQESLTFDGSGSFDVDGAIVRWTWNFGDGTSGSGETAVHAYATAGTYTVSLAVTDDQGLRDSATTTATISPLLSAGETIYRSICQNCHGDPWDGPPVDPGLVAGRRNTGARTCSIDGAINGNLVFPGGVPEMQFLQGMFTDEEIESVSDFLNSQTVSAQSRYVTTCAGCHGTDARGGRVGRDIRGKDPRDVWRALHEEQPMLYLRCIPARPDVVQIGRYLARLPGRHD